VTPLASLGAHVRSDGDTLESYFRSHFLHRPVDATFCGVHVHDGKLPDWSAEGTERLQSDLLGWRALLAKERIATLSDVALVRRDWTVIDGALIDSFAEIQLAELESRHFTRGNPSLATGEVAFGIVSLITRDFCPPPARAESLFSRLRAVPRFIDGVVGMLADTPIPSLWRERATRECAGTIQLLQSGIPRWCAASRIPAVTSNALFEAAQRATAALGVFEQRLRQSPAGPPVRIAGSDLLELLVRRGHWCDRTSDELLAEARARFVEARARLSEMAPEGIAAVLDRLAARHPSRDGYYDSFGRVWDACFETARAHDLVTWPQAPVRYVPIPEWTREAAPSLYYLFYRSPAPFDRQEIHDYVVPPVEGLATEALETHLRSWNDSTIKLNHVVHHGALGHHVQNWYAARAPSRVGQLAATDCASRIAMFLGGTMAEGWACYATDLMDDAGFLTADERTAEQHTRLRQLARAIVDLELHRGGMSFDEAIGFYVDRVGMPPMAARGEVVKNSMFPGTALMYWLGTQGIHDFRAACERREGTRFSLRQFHDRMLSFGSLPIPLIARIP
jgi:hypothetical protein